MISKRLLICLIRNHEYDSYEMVFDAFCDSICIVCSFDRELVS